MKFFVILFSLIFSSLQFADAQEVPDSIADYSFDIGPKVTRTQIAPFLRTIEKSDRYFHSLGVRMKASDKKKWLFKIVATGRGFDGKVPPGRDPGCCSSTSHTHKIGPRPFFDVAHKEWRPERAEQTVAHEYAHGIQFYFKANTYKGGPMGDWTEEGMAEFYGQDIVADRNPARLRRTLKEGLAVSVDKKSLNTACVALNPMEATHIREG